MKKYEVIVIGGGSGLNVAAACADAGMKVAVVEEGPLGGTCLNRGCIPSKMLIHHADVVKTIKESSKFHISSKINKIDFASIVREVNSIVSKDAREIQQGIKETKNMTLYKTRARFIGHKILQVGKERITADNIVIAAGTRPSIPPIKGIDKVRYMTSDEALRLTELPKRLIIVGGGYIAAELAHFFDAMGSEVTIVQRNVLLIPDEDKEIAGAFTKSFSKRMKVFLGHRTNTVSQKGKQIILDVEKKEGGGKKRIVGDALLIATGRVPNSDVLDVGKSGINVNQYGFIESNGYLETNVEGVYVLGDIAGKYLFKHAANLEAKYVYGNAFMDKKEKVNYLAMPHAIFSSPQVAGVGYTEEQLQEKNISYRIGRYWYKNSGMGLALKELDGFVKVLVGKNDEILGCHIIGTDASSIIHEVIVAMRAGIGVKGIIDAVHIHPALPEVVLRAFLNIED